MPLLLGLVAGGAVAAAVSWRLFGDAAAVAEAGFAWQNFVSSPVDLAWTDAAGLLGLVTLLARRPGLGIVAALAWWGTRDAGVFHELASTTLAAWAVGLLVGRGRVFAPIALGLAAAAATWFVLEPTRATLADAATQHRDLRAVVDLLPLDATAAGDELIVPHLRATSHLPKGSEPPTHLVTTELGRRLAADRLGVVAVPVARHVTLDGRRWVVSEIRPSAE
jgi:hypothetical protein